MLSIINKSRLLQGLLFVIWIIGWFFLTNVVFTWADKPVFDTVSLSPHQGETWGSKQALVLQPESDIIVRSAGRNFTIHDSTGKFICTGLPVEMQPSDTDQPFECQIHPAIKTTYKVDTYVSLYTTTQATFDIQQQMDLGKTLLACLVGAIFGTSVIMFLMWLLKAA